MALLAFFTVCIYVQSTLDIPEVRVTENIDIPEISRVTTTKSDFYVVDLNMNNGEIPFSINASNGELLTMVCKSLMILGITRKNS